MSSWKITNKKVNQIGLKRCKVRLPFWFRSNSSNKFYPRSGIECNFHMLKLQENKNKKVHNKIWQQLGQKALHMGRAIAWFHVGHAPSLFGGSSYNVWTPEPKHAWVQTTYLSLFFIFIGLMQLAGVQHFFEKNFKSLNMLY